VTVTDPVHLVGRMAGLAGEAEALADGLAQGSV
jgi:hypothetical protein